MRRNPRILIVTPEITYLPSGMGNMANRMTAKAGGLADVSASLVSALFELGADVHVALPHYRRMFHVDVGQPASATSCAIYQKQAARTRASTWPRTASSTTATQVYSNYEDENAAASPWPSSAR